MSLYCASTAVPVALALGAALLFAFGIHFARRGLAHTDSRTGTLITIGTAAALYWLFAPWLVESHYWLSPAVPLFAAIGLFRPFLSANLAMAGNRFLGPTVSSTLASTAPLFGVALGVLLLDERLTPFVAAGTLAIVAGVATLSWRGGEPQSWPVWALALPVGAALLRSLAQALAKIGMEALPEPFFVGLVGYSVSFAVALAYDRGRRRKASPVFGAGFKWLSLAGLMYGFAILSLNTALACGRLVVVAPIVACSPLFTMLLGAWVFREREIGPRVIVAVLLVVPGVVLVALRA